MKAMQEAHDSQRKQKENIENENSSATQDDPTPSDLPEQTTVPEEVSKDLSQMSNDVIHSEESSDAASIFDKQDLSTSPEDYAKQEESTDKSSSIFDNKDDILGTSLDDLFEKSSGFDFGNLDDDFGKLSESDDHKDSGSSDFSSLLGNVL